MSLDTNLSPWDSSHLYDDYLDIEKYWQQFNNNFSVGFPPEKEEQLLAHLGSDMLDETTMWQNAAQMAQFDFDRIHRTPSPALTWPRSSPNLAN